MLFLALLLLLLSLVFRPAPLRFRSGALAVAVVVIVIIVVVPVADVGDVDVDLLNDVALAICFVFAGFWEFGLNRDKVGIYTGWIGVVAILKAGLILSFPDCGLLRFFKYLQGL